jgi:hypothetical protein
MFTSFLQGVARASSVSSISGEMDLRHGGPLGAGDGTPDLVHGLGQQRPSFRRELCAA